MENSQDGEHDSKSGVRVVDLHLPEDEGTLGFRLTRTQWDPYPWVRDVTPGSAAEDAGLTPGDCLLQADGKDLLGMAVGQVARVIRGDGSGGVVTLVLWSCGVDPRDDPELLWSAGGGAPAERPRRALHAVLHALACCVCAATAAPPRACARSHLYCEACWSRLERCALCREQLPSRDSPHSRNLVAEQVFEAIAKEYDLKTNRMPPKTTSACNSPTRSPCLSPSTSRKLHIPTINPMNRFTSKQGRFKTNYSSDPNIHRSAHQECCISQSPTFVILNMDGNATSGKENGADNCNCQSDSSAQKGKGNLDAQNFSCTNVLIAHKLVARLRPACSMVDLKNSSIQGCPVSGSLNNVAVGKCACSPNHTGSLGDLKKENIAPHLTDEIH